MPNGDVGVLFYTDGDGEGSMGLAMLDSSGNQPSGYWGPTNFGLAHGEGRTGEIGPHLRLDRVVKLFRRHALH